MNGEHWLATRHSLLARLKDAENQTGWQEFFDTYGKLIYGVALKNGLTEIPRKPARLKPLSNSSRREEAMSVFDLRYAIYDLRALSPLVR
jgi:hypothetical protein